jgi:hypothetical protein
MFQRFSLVVGVTSRQIKFYLFESSQIFREVPEASLSLSLAEVTGICQCDAMITIFQNILRKVAQIRSE